MHPVAAPHLSMAKQAAAAGRGSGARAAAAHQVPLMEPTVRWDWLPMTCSAAQDSAKVCAEGSALLCMAAAAPELRARILVEHLMEASVCMPAEHVRCCAGWCMREAVS